MAMMSNSNGGYRCTTCGWTTPSYSGQCPMCTQSDLMQKSNDIMRESAKSAMHHASEQNERQREQDERQRRQDERQREQDERHANFKRMVDKVDKAADYSFRKLEIIIQTTAQQNLEDAIRANLTDNTFRNLLIHNKDGAELVEKCYAAKYRDLFSDYVFGIFGMDSDFYLCDGNEGIQDDMGKCKVVAAAMAIFDEHIDKTIKEFELDSPGAVHKVDVKAAARYRFAKVVILIQTTAQQNLEDAIRANYGNTSFETVLFNNDAVTKSDIEEYVSNYRALFSGYVSLNLVKVNADKCKAHMLAISLFDEHVRKIIDDMREDEREKEKVRKAEEEVYAARASNQSKYFFEALGWIFGIIFLLIFLLFFAVSFRNSFDKSCWPFLIASLLLLPPVRNFVYQKTNIKLPAVARIIAIFALLIVASKFVRSDERREKEKVEANKPVAAEQAKLTKQQQTTKTAEVSGKSYSEVREQVMLAGWKPYIRQNQLEWEREFPELQSCDEDFCVSEFINSAHPDKVREIGYEICSADRYYQCPGKPDGFYQTVNDKVIQKAKSDEDFLITLRHFAP